MQTRQIIVNASAHRLPLPDGFAHCSVTSPPYYKARRYEGDQVLAWPETTYSPMPGLPPLTVPTMACALGWEPTLEAYVGHLVLIYREVYRVLRADGSAWLNIGDGRASSPQRDRHADPANRRRDPSSRCRTRDLAAGNKLLLPFRLALALQADGWIVRADNIWHKLAGQPESIHGWRWEQHRVKVAPGALARQGDPGQQEGWEPHGQDLNEREGATWQECPGCPVCRPHGGLVLRRGSWRHTQMHEYVLHLTKTMGYFADQEIVREPTTGNAHARGTGLHPKGLGTDGLVKQNASFSAAVRHPVSTRNPRSVLTPRVMRGYEGDHFATYPPSLIAPLIRATCPTRTCPHCGTPWAPVIERLTLDPLDYEGKWQSQDPQASGRRLHGNVHARRTLGLPHDNPFPTPTVLGYRPACSCPAHEPVPGWCLDPFVGSGTTLLVCQELGVNGIGCDLAPQYLEVQAGPRLGLTSASNLEELPLFQNLTD